jgi:2-dehydro-3-deoxyphosphooctonate aldolase (KDO 8-P synthase)
VKGASMEPLSLGEVIYEPGRMPLLIAGPCVLEDEDEAMRIASICVELADEFDFLYVFKSSYLKDNRSSVDSYTGPGLEKGLGMLGRIRSETGVPVLTDVHCREEVGPAAEVCDILQIPAFLSRQTRLILAAAGTGKVVNIKKGQFLSPENTGGAVEKARAGGAAGIIITERGTSFGYNNLVVDMTAFPRMRSFDVPLIFDATHSLQLPGGLGDRSGGRPQFAAALSWAAMAAGADGLFVETHPDPGSCSCDAEVMLPLSELETLLRGASRIFHGKRDD